MSATLTRTQRERLTWLAENPARYMVAYGAQAKTAYALLGAGLVERREGGKFYITDAGKAAIR